MTQSQDRFLRILRAAAALGLAAWFGYAHATYWMIVLIGLAMASFEAQHNLDQWKALIRSAGLMQALPGLINAFAMQAIYVALFYAIGFTIGIAQGDPPVAPAPKLVDLALVALLLAFGWAIGAGLRKR